MVVRAACLASADLNCPQSNGREQCIAESAALSGGEEPVSARPWPSTRRCRDRMRWPLAGEPRPARTAKIARPGLLPDRREPQGGPAQPQSNRPNSCVCFACGPSNGILLGHARNSIWPSRKKGTADTRSALATAFHGPSASWAIRNEQIRTRRAIRNRQWLSRRSGPGGLLCPRGRVGHLSPEDHRRRAVHRPLPLGQCASLGCISRKAWQVRRTPPRVRWLVEDLRGVYFVSV